MRNLTKLCLVLFGCAFAWTTALAQAPDFDYQYKYLKSFYLTLSELANQSHYVQITDADGNILLEEKIEDQQSSVRFYNLQDLQKGAYTVTIENQRVIYHQPILANERFLSIDPSQQRRIFKPAVQFAHRSIDINMLHQSSRPVEVNILDRAGEVAFNGVISERGSINKRLNVADLRPGDYQLTIVTEDFILTRDFGLGEELTVLDAEF